MADATLTDLLPYLGVGALLGSQSGATQSGTSTSTSSSAPWIESQPYLKDLFQRAQAMSQNPAASQQMQDAYNSMSGSINPALSNKAGGVVSNALGINPENYYGIGMSNPYLGNSSPTASLSQASNPGSNPYAGTNNPYLNQSIQASQDDAYRAMNPMFQAQQRASGAFGNSGLSEAQTRQMTQTMGNISNNARMADYQTQQQLAESNLNRQMQNNQYNTTSANQMAQYNTGNALNNQQFNANLYNTGLNRDVSQYNTGMSTLNNAAFNTPQYNSASMTPYGTLFNAANMMNSSQWQPLQNYGNLISGGFGGTSTSSTPTYTNPYAGALGGALAGSSMYNLFNTAK